MHDHTPFIALENQDKYRRYKDIMFRTIVGIHELIGHGCGKLLSEINPGMFNFNENDPPINSLTGKAVCTWYKFGESPKSLFGDIATSYSECFAELVALYLIPEPDLLNAMEVIESGVRRTKVRARYEITATKSDQDSGVQFVPANDLDGVERYDFI